MCVCVCVTLMTGTLGLNRDDSWFRTSARSCWCFRTFLIFMILTMAACTHAHTHTHTHTHTQSVLTQHTSCLVLKLFHLCAWIKVFNLFLHLIDAPKTKTSAVVNDTVTIKFSYFKLILLYVVTLFSLNYFIRIIIIPPTFNSTNMSLFYFKYHKTSQNDSNWAFSKLQALNEPWKFFLYL